MEKTVAKYVTSAYPVFNWNIKFMLFQYLNRAKANDEKWPPSDILFRKSIDDKL